MSKALYVDTIAPVSGSVITLASGASLSTPGQIVQVQQTVFRQTFSTNIGDGWIDVPGLSCSITTTAVNSRVLIDLSLNYGAQYYQYKVRLLRDGQVITDALGDQNGSRPRSFMTTILYDAGASSAFTIYDMRIMNGQYMDSPSSAGVHNYTVQIGGYSTSYPVYVNRAHTFSNFQSYDGLPISTLTLWEIQ
jgi:hypothetical protein